MKTNRALILWIAIFFAPATYALDAAINKVVDANGQIQAVLITTPEVIFQVSVYGFLEKVSPNDPKAAAYQRLNQALGDHPIPPPPSKPLEIKYYPPSALDGNAGKISEVNGIQVVYYSCSASNPTLNSIQYGGQTINPAANNGASPLTVNPQYQQACQSLSGNGGKVQRIGEISFSYYPTNPISSNTGGQLRQVGNTTISYN